MLDLKKYENVPTGNICDNMPGKKGSMDSGIKPLSAEMRVIGRAVTVACPPADNLGIHNAMRTAGEGDVIVVDARGYLEAGTFGEMMAVACRYRKIAGIVIDGACRDKKEIIDMGYPVFVRACSPNGTFKNSVGNVNEKINCGGLTVEPGDIIVGDCDGVVVIPKADAEKYLEAGLAKNKLENEQVKQLADGVSTSDLYGFTEIFNKHKSETR